MTTYSTIDQPRTVAQYQAAVDGDTRLRSALRSLAGTGAGWPPPIKVVYGPAAPEERGRGYWFRWRGYWKSAPGSYQASTRRVVVGHMWLAAYERCGRDALAATEAIERAVQRPSAHLRRFLAGWTRDREQPSAPASIAAQCRRALGTGRLVVDATTREAIAVDSLRFRPRIWRADGGRRLESARLRAIVAVAQTTRSHSASCCLASEDALARHARRLRADDIALLETLFLDRQEEERRKAFARERQWRASGHPRFGVRPAEDYLATAAEADALAEADRAGDLLRAARVVQSTEAA